MGKTPNHQYSIPTEGTTDWHIPLNQNFEQIDKDIEIRAPENNKEEYEPKKGAKYEATDSGAVYYGTGSDWMLVNRTVENLESNSSVTGEYLKADDSSTAVVAPSVGSAYDGIQEAIDAGFRDVILAEEITETGIEIPMVDRNGDDTDRFRLSGVGDGKYQTIRDPGTKEAVIRAERRDDRKVNGRVLIENIIFLPEDGNRDDCGFCILGARNIHNPEPPWNGAGNWVIRSVVSRAGPIALVGPRNMVIDCDIANWSFREFPIIGKTDDSTEKVVYDRYAGLFRGATFGMYGGAFMAKRKARSAGYIGTGGWSITGGVTFTNTRYYTDDFASNNLCFIGGTRGFLGGISTEGDTDYDVQFGLEEAGDGPGDSIAHTTITGASAFDSLNIETSITNVRLHAFTDMVIRKKAPGGMEVISKFDVQYEDGHNPTTPQEITHIDPFGGTYKIGGNRSSPQTALGLQIQDAPPNYPQEGSITVSDGANWDPVGNGNAAIVAYDTDGKWKPIFEYSDIL